MAEIAKIRTFYRDPLDLLELALSAVRAKNTAWLQVQRDRLEATKREQAGAAQRLRAEAEERARAAVQPGAPVEAQLAAQRAEKEAADAEKLANRKPGRAQVKSEYAARAMTLRQTWHARIVDQDKALAHFCSYGPSRAALLAVCVQQASTIAKREKSTDAAPPGVEFYTSEKAV
jgi:hypothetical protein